MHPKNDLLVAFGLGKLDPSEATQVAEHLDHCRECSETLVGLQDDTFVGLVRQAPAPPASPAGCEDAPLLAPPADHRQITVDVASGPAGARNQPINLPRELREHSRYEIAELIGRGGMGDVYKAQHKLMNRSVALKVINPELVQHEAAVQRFRREVQAAARLHDRNIVTAYDAEQAGDLHFLVMEYVDGVNLDEVVRQRGRLPVDRACDYIRQAASGLQHAHELGMVHRDIKPHNLMLASSGEVKILDFGLAGFASEAQVDELPEPTGSSSETGGPVHHQLTQSGSMMGTPDYIAPEQARDAHAADIRADIYSLGCTFYTLLAERPPFGPRSVLEKIKAHAQEQAEPLSTFRDDVPSDVEAIVLKMMAKNPAERYQSPSEVADALARFIDQRIDEKLRERDLRELPPGKPLVTAGYDEARDWYDRLAGFMWSVAWCNLLGSSILALLIAWLAMSGAEGLREFATRPFTLLGLFSMVPGALLLLSAPKVRRMESYGWTLFAAFLCLLPSFGSVLGFVVGSVALAYLLQPKYRLPLGAAARVAFADGLLLIATFLGPLALAAAGVVLYIQTDKGLVRVEVADESLQVQLHGKTIEMKDGETPLSIRTGSQKLVVRRGDFEFETDAFELRRRDEIVLKVELLPGEIVVWKDGQRFNAKSLPPGNSISVNSEEDGRNQLRLVRQYSGHDAGIHGVCISPNGQFAVSVSQNGRVIVWDMATAKELQQFKGHTDPVYSIDIASDNRTVATGDRQGNLLLWNAETGQLMRRLEGSKGSVSGLSFTNDGKRLASGGPIEGVRIWDCSSGQVDRILEPRGHVQDVEYSPDGRLIAAGGNDRRLRVWHAETGELLHEIATADNLIRLAWSPDMSQIACSLGWKVETAIHVVNLKERRVERELPLGAGCWGLTYAADGRHLVSVSTDLRLIVWEVESGRQVSAVADPTTGHLSLSPDGKTVLTGGGTKLHLWQLPAASVDEVRGEFVLAGQHAGHTDEIRDLAFLANGTRLASSSADRTFRLWDVNSQREIYKRQCPDWVSSLAISPDGKRAALGYITGTPVSKIEIIDFETKQHLHLLPGPPMRPERLAFSPDGKRLLSAGEEGTGTMWNVATGQKLYEFQQGQGCMKDATFSPDGSRILTASNQAPNIVLRNAADGKPIPEFVSPKLGSVRAARFSPNGGRIVAATDTKEIPIYETATGQRVQTIATPSGTYDVRFWQADQYVIASGQDNVLRIFNTQSGKLVSELALKRPVGNRLALSPDETLLATGGGIPKNQVASHLTGRLGINPRDYDVQLWRLPKSVALNRGAVN